MFKKILLNIFGVIIYALIIGSLSIIPIVGKIYRFILTLATSDEIIGKLFFILILVSCATLVIMTFIFFVNPFLYYIYEKIGVVKIKKFKLKTKVVNKISQKGQLKLECLNLKTQKIRIVNVNESNFNYFLVNDIAILNIQKKCLDNYVLDEYVELTLFDK